MSHISRLGLGVGSHTVLWATEYSLRAWGRRAIAVTVVAVFFDDDAVQLVALVSGGFVVTTENSEILATLNFFVNFFFIFLTHQEILEYFRKS